MAEHEIDAYLAGLDETKRATLEALRAAILAALPEAEQGLAYGVPAFRAGGNTVAGFAAARNHLSYFPHSGRVISEMEADLEAYDTSKGTLRFPIDMPLPEDLVAKLIATRLRQLQTG